MDGVSDGWSIRSGTIWEIGKPFGVNYSRSPNGRSVARPPATGRCEYPPSSVEKVTSTRRMRFRQSMLEEGMCPCASGLARLGAGMFQDFVVKLAADCCPSRLVPECHAYQDFPVSEACQIGVSIPLPLMSQTEFSEVERLLAESLSELKETTEPELRRARLSDMRRLLAEADRLLLEGGAH
jgi:hypothetical protein